MRLVVFAALLSACTRVEVPPVPNKAEEDAFRVRWDVVTAKVLVVHDEKRAVTCWATVYGLSCLPDKDVRR